MKNISCIDSSELFKTTHVSSCFIVTSACSKMTLKCKAHREILINELKIYILLRKSALYRYNLWTPKSLHLKAQSATVTQKQPMM